MADKLDFVDNKFNFLHFGFCLYVIDEELIVNVISEADRVLRHGGMLSILDFDHPELIEKENKHKKELKTFKRRHEKYFLEIGYELVAKLSLTPELNIGFEIDPDNRVALYLLFKP